MEEHLTQVAKPSGEETGTESFVHFVPGSTFLDNPEWEAEVAMETGFENILKDCWTITFYKLDTVFVTLSSDIFLTHPSGKCRLVIRLDTKQYFFFLQTDFPSSLTSLGDIPVAKMYEKQNGDPIDDRRSSTTTTGQGVSAQ